MAYKKCPRCNLNYIRDTDVLCGICRKEVGKALRSKEEEEYDICPECGEHIIKAGEEMCYQCRKEKEKEDPDTEESRDDHWDDFSEEEEDRIFEEEDPDLEEDPESEE